MELELDQTHIVSVLKIFPFKGQSFVDWEGFEAETEFEMKSQLNRESCGNVERKRSKVTCVERDSEKVYLVQYASVRFDMYDLTGCDILHSQNPLSTCYIRISPEYTSHFGFK